MAVSPNGKFLYVGENGAIEVFAIDSNGNASAPPAATITGNISGMAIDPAGTFLFVSNSSFNPPQVETYSIDPATGQITPAGVYQVASAGPNVPVIRDLEIDSGNHLFLSVTNNGAAVPAGYIQVFNIAGNGTISPIAGTSTFSTGGASGLGPNRLALNSGKTLLFSSNQFDASVSAFTVGGTGALTLVGSPITTGGGTMPLGIAVDLVANVLVVVDNLSTGNNVLVYTFTSGGVLSPAPTPSYASGGGNPTGVTIDPTGKNVYVSNTSTNNVTRFALNASGVLSSPFVATTGGLSPQFLVANFAPASATGVPTLSTWVIVLLGALLAASSLLMYRRTARQS